MCDDGIHPGRIDASTQLRGILLADRPGSTASGALAVVEIDVEVPTADGQADAALFHPEGDGRWPAVLVWPDALGLRPVFREMGRRLAAEGYVVLVPNPYYRGHRAPVVKEPFDF